MDAHADLAPSPWVTRFGVLVQPGGPVLDVACGRGRHARWFAGRGHPVTAVDRDAVALEALTGLAGVTTRMADLEAGTWPYIARRFAAVVVTNYLYRPLFPALLDALDPDGVLIYETFAEGNQAYGRPTNPDFLLRRGELLETVHGRLRVQAYEDGLVEAPRPAVVQRICAIREVAEPGGSRPV
jgi:SAM-dependent methyltransferase